MAILSAAPSRSVPSPPNDEGADLPQESETGRIAPENGTKVRPGARLVTCPHERVHPLSSELLISCDSLASLFSLSEK